MHQIRYNAQHEVMPKQIKRNKQAPNLLLPMNEEIEQEKLVDVPSPILMAADTKAEYNAEAENIDILIQRARENMEVAAKVLDFTAAKRYRDHMYYLEKVKHENGGR